MNVMGHTVNLNPPPFAYDIPHGDGFLRSDVLFFFLTGLQSNVNELSANMYSKHSVYLSIKDIMKQILI